MTPGIWTGFAIWAAICTVGLLLTLLGEYHKKVLISATGKLIAASAYVAAAYSLGAQFSPYGRFLMAGMLFCWLGDQLLVAQTGRRLFVTGLAAFLIGHLLYSTAFLARGVAGPAMAAGFVIMSVFAWRVGRWLGPHLDSKMRVPVNLYVAAISLMVITAAGSFRMHGSWALLAGAVLFLISDLAVARNRFVAPGIVNRLWGLPVYFTAQMLLAASVLP
jgi:uncharacterized membrane protein YhhN